LFEKSFGTSGKASKAEGTMLDPADRQLLLEALRPPEGFELYSALGTTFSLDLIALLMIPLAFTRFDYEDEDGRPNPDPLALLEAVRRHSDRLTVFCQAGEIGVPRDMHRLYTYLEGSVVEVAPSDRHGVFHPKVWLLRYVSLADEVRYRLLCLSRNLTLDRSWDALLSLEGDFRGDRQVGFTRNRPLGDFVAHLSKLAVRPMAASVAARVQLMQDEVRRVDFEFPSDVEGIQFWPNGIPGASSRGLGEGADRVLVVSPFICENRLAKLGARGARNVLVSRQDELDRLPTSAYSGFKECYVLSSLASEEPSGEDQRSAVQDPLSGLHAKIILGEYGWNASLWIGSANATTAAITKNVEFMVELQGKRSVLGIDRLLSREKGETSFADLLQTYTPPDAPLEVDPVEERLEQVVREVRTAVAISNWTLAATPTQPNGHATYRVLLTRSDSEPLSWGDSVALSLWLVSLRRDSASRQLVSPYKGETDLGELSADGLTALVAFEITAKAEGRELSCRFVLNVPLAGGPPDRREAVLRSLLKDKAKVLRFLLFLLASDVAVGEGDLDFFNSGLGGPDETVGREETPLLECLVRCLDREPSKLDTIASLITTLRQSEGTRDLLPEGFAEVWDAVWEARQELLQ
jgi:hypothetical protein